MSIPMPQSMDQEPVTWTLAHTTGKESLAGARGFVRFEPTAVAVAFPSITVLPSPVEARVIAGVMEPVDLMVNDPELWNWRVTPEVGVPWQPFHVDVLGPVDLATVAVVPGRGPIRAVVGPPGRGLNLLGEKATIGDLPAGATEGDAWLVDNDLHVWGGGRWVNAGPIRGPQGIEGGRGPQGERGEKGAPGDKGDPGETGLQGIPGPANHLTIGEVTTGPTPSASITGETPAQKLNLTFGSDTVEGLTARLNVLERDTGALAVTANFPQVTRGSITVRRVGKAVYVTLLDIEFATSTPPEFFYITGLLPVGYRPLVFTSFAALADVNGTATRRIRFQPDGQILLYQITPTSRINVTASYLTPDAWPA